jgi:hypothetical protein
MEAIGVSGVAAPRVEQNPGALPDGSVAGPSGRARWRTTWVRCPTDPSPTVTPRRVEENPGALPEGLFAAGG